MGMLNSMNLDIYVKQSDKFPKPFLVAGKKVSWAYRPELPVGWKIPNVFHEMLTFMNAS